MGLILKFKKKRDSDDAQLLKELLAQTDASADSSPELFSTGVPPAGVDPLEETSLSQSPGSSPRAGPKVDPLGLGESSTSPAEKMEIDAGDDGILDMFKKEDVLLDPFTLSLAAEIEQIDMEELSGQLRLVADELGRYNPRG